MQTEPYDSITACVRQTYKEEGVRGFFRGIIIEITQVQYVNALNSFLQVYYHLW